MLIHEGLSVKVRSLKTNDVMSLARGERWGNLARSVRQKALEVEAKVLPLFEEGRPKVTQENVNKFRSTQRSHASPAANAATRNTFGCVKEPRLHIAALDKLSALKRPNGSLGRLLIHVYIDRENLSL